MQQFANSFKDEAELRVALISLLEKLPNTKNIRHTHGSGELGKDIVFTSAGPFGRDELIACVIKNDPLSGSADSNRGARTVFIQAEQCLDTPVINHKGIPENISSVFVITPHECSTASITSITSKLNKSAGTVRFIFGRELFDLFEEHYPDYLLFRSGLFGSYVSDLERGLADDTAIANVLIRHGLTGRDKEMKHLYVQPRFTQSICKFSFKLRRSRLEIPEEMQEMDLLFFSNHLRHLVRFFSLVAPPSERKPFETASTLFLKDLRRSWQKSFERQFRFPSRHANSDFRREAKVQLSDLADIKERLSTLLSGPLELCRDLERDLEHANNFASGKPSSLQDFLLDTLSLKYSFVAGISKQIPGLLEAGPELCKITTSSDELLGTDADFLLTAPAGFGKTSFCRWNVLRDLKMLKEQKSTYIPVYVPLHQLAGRTKSGPEHLFIESAGVGSLWDKRNTKGIKRKFRFYLDGLDEVPNENEQRHLLDLAAQLKQAAPESQIILTGREHVAGPHVKGYVRMHVSEMSESQLSEFIAMWFGTDIEEKEKFTSQLRQFDSLHLVMRAPLLATLVLEVYSSTGTVPESRARLYDMFISLMAGGWDVAKHLQRDTQFGPQPKVTVLQSLAGRLQLSNKRDASTHEFGEAVKEQLPSLTDEREMLLGEIVHDGLLVPIGDHYAFSHLSFQEYLAAKDLMEPTGRKATTALSAFLRGHHWWREVLGFYVTLSDQPRAMEIFVRDGVERVAKKSFDDQIIARAHYLLDQIVSAYPGARPDYKFPQLGGIFSQPLFDEDFDFRPTF